MYLYPSSGHSIYGQDFISLDYYSIPLPLIGGIFVPDDILLACSLSRFTDQRLHDLDRPLELDLVLRRRLDHARATAAPTRSSIHPHQIVTSKRDADVHLVDVLAPWRLLRRDLPQDVVELADELLRARVGRSERFGERVLERRRAVRTHRCGDLQLGALGCPGDGVDCAGGRWRKAACDACAGRSTRVNGIGSLRCMWC